MSNSITAGNTENTNTPATLKLTISICVPSIYKFVDLGLLFPFNALTVEGENLDCDLWTII